MEITVDDAVAAIIAAAEKHETEHPDVPGEPPFCPHTRAAHVAHLMLNLGLSLEDIGLVATHFMDGLLAEQDIGDDNSEWSDVVCDEERP